ncbi:hypothetical protein NDU88_003602 [Pleurodeles waltl]|uniref:Uncharacterized protein n=1 Tax=Pleurodeles waltl TaxID=8319 RepID=A0AAV7M3W2_PLEWA|nr:hypothetical protein NDU88_003602 [Pleurodeles waltl]
MGSLLSCGRHFGSRQPQSSQGKFQAKSASKEGRRGPYPCRVPSDHLSSIFKTSGRNYGRIHAESSLGEKIAVMEVLENAADYTIQKLYLLLVDFMPDD